MGVYQEVEHFTPDNACEVRLPESEVLPLVFDSPHSGLNYPSDFGYRESLDHLLLRSPEDAHVEELFAKATEHGAVMLQANFPRAYIDVNRRVGDIDVNMIDGAWPFTLDTTKNSASGAGLFWRVVRKVHEIYGKKIKVEDAIARVENCYLPYHEKLRSHLDRLHAEFGGVWHMDCHSCQSYSLDAEGKQTTMRPDIILGNRHGTTCDADFVEVVRKSFADLGYEVIVNTMFPGAELVVRYGDPANNRHSLQVEIRRDLYMDDDTHDKNERFDKMKQDCEVVMSNVAEFVHSKI